MPFSNYETPFRNVEATAGRSGLGNTSLLNNKAKARLLTEAYQNQQAVEAAKLGYQARIDAYKPQETSWGDIAMNVAGSAAQAGLFDSGNQFSGRGSAGTDAMGLDFDDPAAGNYGLTSSGGGSNWLNVFGW
tara:strand:+ start:339 stop:734 length:396 start_codon:yes stop_codon:yes gene_type:complete